MNDASHMLVIYQPVLWRYITYAVVTKKRESIALFKNTSPTANKQNTEPVLRNNLKPGQGAAVAHIVQRPCHRLMVRFPGEARQFSVLHSLKAVSGTQGAQYSKDTGREALSSGIRRPGLKVEY